MSATGGMSVAQLVRPHRFEFIDQPPPEPGPGEVRVRVRAVGVCGSDLHYFSEGSIGDTTCVYPMVLGHEPAGEIDKIGAGVAGWTAGDRAIFEPALYCYHCEYCLTGRHNICEKIRFLSMPPDPGFLREYVNLPLTNLLPLPPGMSMEEGTVAEPLAVVLHSLHFASPRPGETAVVFGAGPIGLLTVAALRLCGAPRIWAVEPVASRRSLALAMGASAALDPSEDAARSILRETGKRGVDMSFDCASKGETLNECLHATRNGGRVILTGISSVSRVPVEFHVMRRKELALFNVRRSNHDTEAATELLAREPARFRPMLTHTLPLGRVQEAFEIAESYRDGVGKMVIGITS
jgi:L-iditol 2-dehydrogenase